MSRDTVESKKIYSKILIFLIFFNFLVVEVMCTGPTFDIIVVSKLSSLSSIEWTTYALDFPSSPKAILCTWFWICVAE